MRMENQKPIIEEIILLLLRGHSNISVEKLFRILDEEEVEYDNDLLLKLRNNKEFNVNSIDNRIYISKKQ